MAIRKSRPIRTRIPRRRYSAFPHGYAQITLHKGYFSGSGGKFRLLLAEREEAGALVGRSEPDAGRLAVDFFFCAIGTYQDGSASFFRSPLLARSFLILSVGLMRFDREESWLIASIRSATNLLIFTSANQGAARSSGRL